MKKNRVLFGTLLGLLIAVSLVAAYLHPDPLAVARAACAERALPIESLAALRTSGLLFGSKATVEFYTPAGLPVKRIAVDLSQPAYFLPWQVVEVREQPG
ncbi:MAG TPA: hypothetical protein VH120_21480 [Gemmataceae bacterium]|jgi:hypothetical protein|nr:hypothetical protein [Gemmataceae bacterium]